MRVRVPLLFALRQALAEHPRPPRPRAATLPLTLKPLPNPQIRARKWTRPPASSPPTCARHDRNCRRPRQTPRPPPARPGAGTHLPMDRRRVLLRRAKRARSLMVSRARTARLRAALRRTRLIAFLVRLICEIAPNESPSARPEPQGRAGSPRPHRAGPPTPRRDSASRLRAAPLRVFPRKNFALGGPRRARRSPGRSPGSLDTLSGKRTAAAFL